MPHNAACHYAAFHQGLHCLLRRNRSSGKFKEIHDYVQQWLGIIACDPSINTMDHPDLIMCHFMENSFGTQRVKKGKINQMSQCMRFPTIWYGRPVTPQISLRISAV